MEHCKCTGCKNCKENDTEIDGGNQNPPKAGKVGKIDCSNNKENNAPLSNQESLSKDDLNNGEENVDPILDQEKPRGGRKVSMKKPYLRKRSSPSDNVNSNFKQPFNNNNLQNLSQAQQTNYDTGIFFSNLKFIGISKNNSGQKVELSKGSSTKKSRGSQKGTNLGDM